MPNRTDTDDLLGLNVTLTLSPAIEVERGAPVATPPANDNGFLLHADAALQYASFSQVLTALLAGKRFDISEGLFAKHVVIKNVTVSGTSSKAILLNVHFTGSFSGAAMFTAIPVYNEETATIVLLQPRYDLQTGSLLLKGARLLFASRIEKELKKIARLPVQPVLEKIQTGIRDALNREWSKGIKGSGDVEDLRLLGIEAMPDHLLLRVSCKGSLQITISEMALNFKR